MLGESDEVVSFCGIEKCAGKSKSPDRDCVGRHHHQGRAVEVFVRHSSPGVTGLALLHVFGFLSASISQCLSERPDSL